MSINLLDVKLLVGNSLVRDIDVMLTADGAETIVCCKSGASFAEIGDMIDEAANHDKWNGIVVVGGTKEAMGNVSIDENSATDHESQVSS